MSNAPKPKAAFISLDSYAKNPRGLDLSAFLSGMRENGHVLVITKSSPEALSETRLVSPEELKAISQKFDLVLVHDMAEAEQILLKPATSSSRITSRHLSQTPQHKPGMRFRILRMMRLAPRVIRHP